MPRVTLYTAVGAGMAGLAGLPAPAAADALVLSPGLIIAHDSRGPDGRTALGAEVTANSISGAAFGGFGFLLQLEFDFDGGVRAVAGGQAFTTGVGLEAGFGWYRPADGPPTTELQLAPFLSVGYASLAGRLILGADGPDGGVALALKYPLVPDGAVPFSNGCGGAVEEDGAVCGRPLRGVDGEPWRAPIALGGPARRSALTAAADALDRPTRRRLADAWLEDARDEHAAIGAFCQLAMHLTAHGAPRALVDGARRASRDEVGHARRAFEIASALAGRNLRPLALPPPRRPVPGLAELAAESWLDGAMNEGRAAAEARVGLGTARVGAVRALLDAISREEARHAKLGLAVAEWAAGRDPEARQALDAAREQRPFFASPLPGATPAERAWGRVS